MVEPGQFDLRTDFDINYEERNYSVNATAGDEGVKVKQVCELILLRHN